MDVRLSILPEHPCPYLPNRTAQFRAFAAGRLSGELYHDFMDAGFRRSGRTIYQTACVGCRACVPLRVPVETFRPNKSQRRCERRNADLLVSVADPRPSREKFELYRRYVLDWHSNSTAAGVQREGELTEPAFESFLYDSPVPSVEFEYRLPTDNRLLAVGLCDLSTRSLSSVYFYFDPASAERGLGTFGAVTEIEWARRVNVPFYYLGFWVKECAAMAYKNRFQPCEYLNAAGQWA